MNSSLRFLAFALGAGLAFTAPSAAQAQVSVGVQIGAPAWGPPVPQGTQYYYIPEIDGYYDIYNQVYIVFDGQQWVQLPYLDGYDPYYFHPYPVSYVGPQPWLYIGTYRRSYPQYVAGWRRGGWGGNGPYYGHEYGAGRVYGYGGRPGGYYEGNRGYYGNGYNGRPGGFDNRGGNGGFGRPGYSGGFPNGNQPGGNNAPRGGQPGGGFQGPGGGQPQPGNQGRNLFQGRNDQLQRGGFGGGGQPGGGNPGGGGQPGGFGNGGGGRRGGR